MKRTRVKISVLVGLSVILITVVLMILFDIAMNHQIKTQAEKAIQETITYSFDEESTVTADTASPYYAEMVVVADDEDGEEFYNIQEQNLVSWARSNVETGTVKVTLDDNTYYVQTIDLSDYEGINQKMLIYTNVTGELSMIPDFLLMFAFAGIIFAALGCIVGYRIGVKLEQNEMAQRKFFENTSHELKTPLTAIRGYGEGIASGVITDYKKTGNVIISQTEKMSHLVEEILMQAKLESGVVNLKKEPVNLEDFIQDCLMPLEGAIKNRNLKVELSLENATVNADYDQLEHSISNLLINAIRYAATTIKINCTQNEIRIWNDCHQIDKEELAHIFDRFYTSRENNPDQKGSTGIGLAIAKEIIELHGWKISAQNNNGGLIFIITF